MAAPIPPFPPSFDGNPWTYGGALFGLTLCCAFCIAKLMHMIFESRSRRHAETLIYAVPPTRPLPWLNPLSVYHGIIASFLIAFLLVALPDVLVLMTWGEGGADLIAALFLLDRLCDLAFVFPFMLGLFLIEYGSQSIQQQLVRRVRRSMLPPKWSTLKQPAKIAMIVLTIAIVITLAKARGLT